LLLVCVAHHLDCCKNFFRKNKAACNFFVKLFIYVGGYAYDAQDCDLRLSVSVTFKAIVVSWEPPPEGARNGQITGYKIRYKQRGERGAGDSATTDGSRRSYELTGNFLTLYYYCYRCCRRRRCCCYYYYYY
jgi:hypothetical protein